jgi:hypothetical protein
MKSENKKIFLISLSVVLTTFLFTYFFGYFLKLNIPYLDWRHNISIREDRVFTQEEVGNIGHPLYLLNNFDSNFYLQIAIRGYDKEPYNEGNTEMRNWAFYPLYPSFVSLISSMLGVVSEVGIFKVGLVISNLFYLLFLVILYHLVKLLGYTYEDWIYLLIVICVFPTSYFLNIFYTESMFLFLSTMSLLLSFKKRYFLSSLFIILSSFTRNVGVLLFIPLALVLIKDGEIKPLKKLINLIIYGTISVLGVLVFFTYIYSITGNFFSSLKIQSAWGRGNIDLSIFPFRSLFIATQEFLTGSASGDLILLINYVITLIGILALIYFYFLSKGEYKKIVLSVYSFFYISFITATASSSSIARYLLVLLPILLVPIEIRYKRKVIFSIIISAFSFLHAIFLTLFILRIPSPGI